MATILAHIEVHSGRELDFESLVQDLFAATQLEGANRHYEYWRGTNPGFYYCLLAFDDFNAFIKHQTSDHHEEASPKLGELIEKIRLEWVDPIAGASKLPSTNKQTLPPDADQLTQRYHDLFAPTLQEWWNPLRPKFS